jgi:predicted transcriptional regulator
MKPFALTPAQQRRLEKLAREAGRTPAQTLKFVLRDGFDYCEWQVRESNAAEAEAKHAGTVPHEVVMREARAMIEAARVRRRRKTARVAA